jgi:uncharacterized DUF497 family protein
MQFRWDEAKRLRTLDQRGLDFRHATDLFDGRPLYTFGSPRADEARFVSIGMMEQRCVAVVWMDREGMRRIISMRRARRGEEAEFRKLLD